jgi:hypothetical protein
MAERPLALSFGFAHRLREIPALIPRVVELRHGFTFSFVSVFISFRFLSREWFVDS